MRTVAVLVLTCVSSTLHASGSTSQSAAKTLALMSRCVAMKMRLLSTPINPSWMRARQAQKPGMNRKRSTLNVQRSTFNANFFERWTFAKRRFMERFPIQNSPRRKNAEAGVLRLRRGFASDAIDPVVSI